MTMTKEQIVDMLKTNTKLSAIQAKEVVEAILETMKSRLAAGEDVKISGFGKWMVRQKTTRPGRNPHTGEKIEITARRVVTFQSSEKLCNAIAKSNISEAVMARNAAEDDTSI